MRFELDDTPDRQGAKQVGKGEGIEEIRKAEEISRIRSILTERPRDLLLFTLAVEGGIRMKELLGLKVKQLMDLQVGERLPSSGALDDSAVVTETIREAFVKYVSQAKVNPEDFLFKSTRGPLPLNLSSVSNMVNSWFKAANIERASGARSLRKLGQRSGLDGSRSQFGLPGKTSPHNLFEPIKLQSVQETVYRKVFEAIISGKILPGSRLTAGELCQRFKVSPTPVRVALTWLEARGFVVSQQKRACLVKQLSLPNLEEIVAIRLALETFAVEASYKTWSEETSARLESLLQVFEKTTDLDEYQQINARFHQTLYSGAKMPLLEQLISDLCNRVAPYFVLYLWDLDNVEVYRKTAASCHRGMLEGVRRKDPREVRKWLKEDLSKGMARLTQSLKASNRSLIAE